MTLSAFLNLFVRATFLLLTLLALRDLWRHRDQARLGIAAMLGSLAVVILAGRLQPRNDTEMRWLQSLVILGLVSHPYLLLQLVSIFRPVSHAVRWIATGGLALCWLLILLSPAVMSFPLTLVLIVYFVTIEGYAAVALLRGARNAGGVSRWRLLLIAAGTIMLATAILVPQISSIVPPLATLGEPLFLVLAVATAVSYYLGFATPRWLQRAWQLAELDRFLYQAAGGRIDRNTRATLRDVCRAATRAVAGVTTVALVGEKSATSLAIAASDGPSLGLDELSLAEPGVASRVWHSQQPEMASAPDAFGLAESVQLAEVTGAYSLLAVPIATAVHAPGLLLVFVHRRPLFADDDLALLKLYAEQTATTLDNITLLAEQREMVQRLVQNEARLEELVTQRTEALLRLNEELEQRVHARTAQLEVANKELESFAYSVSHDLRAPLRAIDGFSQALLEDCADQIDDLGQDYLERVRANTQRMGELIDALLLLSRLSRAEMRLEAVDLSALAQHIATDLQRGDNERQVEFSIKPELVVEGDARLLRVVLENLLGNAWKFSGARSEACIEFGAVEQDGERAYFVRDNGVGFDMAYAHKLFGAFQRLHPMNEFAGTGIGLATVQRVVHRHQGQVWARAAPEEGATFFFTLAANGEDDGK